MNTQKRRGFTLVELLVVIAIIGILIALLLPAVQAAREAARRSQCTNNLAQLAIALHNYEGSYELLPPGSVNDTGPIKSEPAGYHMSWLVQILPYIEEAATQSHIDFSAGVYDEKNAPVRNVVIRPFQCPSDGGSYRGRSRAAGGEEANFALGNYAACHHDVEAPIAEDNHGVMFLNSHVPIVDVTDGTTHTIFAGEKLVRDDDLGWMSGTRATLRNTGQRPNLEEDRRRGRGRFGEEEPPQPPQGDPLLAVGGFSSMHPGGANFMMGDGSIRFIAETIDDPLFQQLGHRSDGKLREEDY
jgi:prepilin-type N-terminal cleavage/methylation domain-containing protein/prepilin-type processing-associated H-X9-DG protein